jgi:hypothetical protein
VPRHVAFSSISPYLKEPIRLKSLKFNQIKNALPTIFASGTKPQARLSAVVTIVTHHEIVTIRNFAHNPGCIVCAIFPVRKAAGIGNKGRRIGIVQGDGLRHPAFPETVRNSTNAPGEDNPSFLGWDWLAVDDQLLVLIGHRISRQANDTLDVIQRRIFRVTNITSPRAAS